MNSKENAKSGSNNSNPSERKLYPLTYEMLIQEDCDMADFLTEKYGPKSSENTSEKPKQE